MICAAPHDVGVQLFAPQIEEAVVEPRCPRDSRCSPKTGSGSSAAGPRTSISVTKTSTAPVGSSGFSVPAGRRCAPAVDP